MTFLRYNPDAYDPAGRQKALTSYKREEKLIEWVRYAQCHPPTDRGSFADVLYLFYDEYDVSKPEWHPLMAMET